MTMRIIFLDIDGVLNTERYSAWLQDRGMPCRDQYGILMFDPSAVANLKRILNALPDVRIVWESTWTFAGHPDALRFMWAERGLPGALHDVIETIFTKHVLNIGISDPADVKKVEDLGKNKAIRAWLRRNAGPDDRYVILDDMADFRGKLFEHTVYVNPWVGLTEFDAKEVIMRLK